MEVSNECAKGRVIVANVTVYNGVIHIVNGLLGFVHNNLYDAISNIAHE